MTLTLYLMDMFGSLTLVIQVLDVIWLLVNMTDTVELLLGFTGYNNYFGITSIRGVIPI